MKPVSTATAILVYIIPLFLFTSCQERVRSADPGKPVIGVTTSYLECAAGGLGGDSFSFIRLVPPGMCPGHFDLSPGMITDIRSANLLIRFDFQSSLDKKIESIKRDIPIVGIKAPEGLCIPESYRKCLLEIHGVLLETFPEKREDLERSLEKSLKELELLEARSRVRIRKAGYEGKKVIASGHQAEFCRWLGLDVAAAWSGSRAAKPRELQEILEKGRDSGIEIVVANLQEGRQQAEALASHLKARLVVMSNFPDMTPDQDSFASLVRWNVDQLIGEESSGGNE